MRQKKKESVCVIGKIDIRTERGRPSINLAVGGGTTSAQLLHMAERRSVWHSMVFSVPRDTTPRQGKVSRL